MATSHYIGKAGHLAVMGELCFRGYNVAMPEIDKGDDVFVVNDATGAMWRLQVKTASGTQQKKSRRFGFRVREAQIQTAQTPELHFIFCLRMTSGWKFLVMDRPVLRNYVNNSGMGTRAGTYRQLNIVLHKDGRCICSGLDLQNHIGDWATWPEKD